MGAKQSDVATAKERQTAADRLSALATSHLLHFDSKLENFCESVFGISTPRALAAAEPMYVDSALELIKAFLRRAGPAISDDVRSEIFEKILTQLLIDERVGAVNALVNDKELRISPSVLNKVTPLSEHMAKSVLARGNVMFLGQAAYLLCPGFMRSSAYEDILCERILSTVVSKPLGALVDIVDAVPLPQRVMLATRPVVYAAILDHVRARNLPEEIITLAKPYQLRDFLRDEKFKAVLEKACCAALHDGDLKFISEVVEAFVGQQFLGFEDVLTDKVREAAVHALDNSQAECDYFALLSETPESGPETTAKLSQDMRQLSRLLDATSEFRKDSSGNFSLGFRRN
jgi:hypothetical protein